jgi:hypothetical protein
MKLAVTGYKEMGKDSTYKCFRKYGYQRTAFADPLREMAYATDPLVDISPRDKAPGTVVIRLRCLVDQVGWDKAKLYPDVRRFMQRLGTEGVRHTFGERAWIDKALRTASTLEKPFITDLRFLNEEKALRDEGYIIIRVVDPRKPIVTAHQSEKEVGLIKEDYLIVNDGTLDDLQRKVDELWEILTSDLRRKVDELREILTPPRPL